MLNRLRQILWALTAPISGSIGWQRLKLFSKKEDSDNWIKCFEGKRILLVGTGPSLDRANEKYFQNFDSIIYINHAVKCAGNAENEFFFSTDINVVKEITKKPYFQNIRKLGSHNSILAPIFFQQTLWLSKEFIGYFCWIKANGCAYKVHWSSGRFKMPVSLVLWPVQPDFSALEQWFSQSHQVNYFPVFEKTSALSAILFAAKYRPYSITLIGCDFGKGRAKNIEVDCPAHTVDIFGGAAERFEYIKKFLDKKKIPVRNDSWE